MSLFGSLFHDTESKQEVKNVLDLVTYTASLASNPTEVDSLIDQVRKVTATHAAQNTLSPAEEATLIHVYLGLERYLTTRDPIRTYTKDELRGRLNPDLLTKLTQQEAKGDA
ncbi:MAG TPA: hypothetical protein PK096_02270 [Candidatus Saccharibacteria bacterium]|nr:hypothetical protein [Candidatus Saccharibacteria bacterium]HRK94171.1 hypothetical protein [Candidatus Saccharibacteria bacterium]